MSELQVARCERCGHVAWPARLLCPACGADEAVPVGAGPGTVTEQVDTATPAGEPVALVTVALDSGPRVVARTADARAGDPVTLAVEADGAIVAARQSSHQPGDTSTYDVADHHRQGGRPMPSSAVTDLAAALQDDSVRVVDLTQPLSETTPVLVLPDPFANTPHLSRRPLSEYDDRGPAWAWDVLELGEHTGTHLDAPIHWITGRDGQDVSAIPPARLVGPAVVVDRTAEVAQDPGYLVSAADFEAHESEHGPIAPGSWVLLRTGWGARAQDEAAFLNIGDEGPVTPGPDVSGAHWLAEHPHVVGFGCETVGIDAGAAGGMDPGFPVHNFLLGAGRYGLTQLAGLEALPATGALLVVAPLKLVRGTGSPSRVFAFVAS